MAVTWIRNGNAIEPSGAIEKKDRAKGLLLIKQANDQGASITEIVTVPNVVEAMLQLAVAPKWDELDSVIGTFEGLKELTTETERLELAAAIEDELRNDGATVAQVKTAIENTIP